MPATAILRWSWRQYGLRMNASTDNWQTLMPRARESTPGSYGDRYDYGTLVIMLKAGWFEYRWRQTGEQQFIRLADETWRQLRMKG